MATGSNQTTLTRPQWVSMAKDLVQWYEKEHPSEDKLDPKLAAVALSAAEFDVAQARINLVARMHATPLTPDEEMLQIRGIAKDQLNEPDLWPVGDPSNQKQNWLKAKNLAVEVADELDTTFGEPLWKAMLGTRSPPDAKDTGGAKPHRGESLHILHLLSFTLFNVLLGSTACKLLHVQQSLHMISASIRRQTFGRLQQHLTYR